MTTATRPQPGRRYFPMVKLAVYSATNHVVNGFTEALRAELGPHEGMMNMPRPQGRSLAA